MVQMKIMSISISLIVFLVFISGCIEETPIEKKPLTVYVDLNGEADFTNIQDAIDYVYPEGTVFVNSGIYHEILTINKSINLIGANKDSTVISCILEDIPRSNSIIYVNADNCNIEGFNISCEYFSSGIIGIYLNTNFTNITNNIVNNYNQGIYINLSSNNNIISENTILNSKHGIDAYGSEYNNILKNNISFSTIYGLYLHGSHNNIISGNILSNNNYGIRITSSNNNQLFYNTIINNTGGLRLCCASRNNIVFNNIFAQNQDWNAIDEIINQWDNGSVGNYWDDYQEIYPDANKINGIWDTPYTITEDIVDRYPLINPPNI